MDRAGDAIAVLIGVLVGATATGIWRRTIDRRLREIRTELRAIRRLTEDARPRLSVRPRPRNGEPGRGTDA